MTKQRLDRWKEAKYLLTMLSGLSGEDNDLSRLVPPSQAANDKAKVVTSGFTDFSIIEACKELIFDYKDDNPVFYMILYSFDI